jgi:hypothetical protein
MNKKKVVVFGLGKVFETFIKLFDYSKAEIIALSDNNREVLIKKGGTKAIDPEKIVNLQFDYLVITCKFYDAISEQFKGYGIKEEYIVNFYNVYRHLIIENGEVFSEILRDRIPLARKYENEFESIRLIEENTMFLSAKIFINLIKDKKLISLEEAEFKGYSQFGEDGIIQWLIHNVQIEQKIFIEFGAGDYFESNTRFLLMNNNWSGFVMDSSSENMECLKHWRDYWKYDLKTKSAFITKNNINKLITDAGYTGDIGILSIDLDGVDYWVLNAIDCVSPRILICEYNNIFGEEKMVSIPYDENFDRTKSHYSWLYWGASLAAFSHWASNNNYYYMGSNSAGHNAFFVRKDCISVDKIPQNANKFVECKYSESRGKNGELTYKRGREALECIKQMRVFDLEMNCEDTIENIYEI